MVMEKIQLKKGGEKYSRALFIHAVAPPSPIWVRVGKKSENIGQQIKCLFSKSTK